MDASILKNVLQTVIHFLETGKYIDLQDDDGNDLELFLVEFNRFRTMLELPTYRLEKRMPMIGRGDWFGRGEKVRFVEDNTPPAQPIAIAEAAAKTLAQPGKLEEPTYDGPPPIKKITRTRLLEILTTSYETFETREGTRNEKPAYYYYHNDVPIGFWSKGKGWHA